MCTHICHIYFVIKFSTIKIGTVISLLKSTSNFTYYEIPYFISKYVYSAVGGLPCTDTSWRRVKNKWNQRHRPWGSSEKLKQTHLLRMWGWPFIFLPVPKGCYQQKGCVVHFSLVHITWPDIASHLAGIRFQVCSRGSQQCTCSYFLAWGVSTLAV